MVESVFGYACFSFHFFAWILLHGFCLNFFLLLFNCRTFNLLKLYLFFISSGWGTSRFEGNRPVSLQPDSISFSRVSAESSSESEAQSISSVSGVKGSKSKEERRSGMFRIFGRKGGDKEKEKEKRRSSQTPHN